MSQLPVNRPLLVHGAIIMILGLAIGFTIPGAARPQTLLAAHVIGILAGVVAMATGVVFAFATLSKMWESIAAWLLVVSLYLGLATQWVGGEFELSRMFVVTAAGLPEGNQTLEWLVQMIVMAISPLTILPFIILACGFWAGGAKRAA